ncbi:MAG: autotransporter-associated beta strand repeat-containing protein, partial [Verrucomicrobiota bacterium]
ALVFGGTARFSPNNNFPAATSFNSLIFAPGAGAFVLGGDSITMTGGLTDNAASLETVNLPIALSASQNFSVTSGGLMTVNNIISGAGFGLTKTGGGALTLTGQAAGASGYSGGTTLNSGLLLLDFSQGGSTPANNLIAEGALALGGGALTVQGNSAAANSQSFTLAALNAGPNVITAVNGASGGTATVNLSGLTVNPGASVVFYGPATTNGSTAVNVPATGAITTTTAGQGQTTAGECGILAAGAGNNAYATVGLYDWATTDTPAGVAGTNVLGGSQVAGFYVVPANNSGPSGALNWDIATQQTVTFSTASTARISGSATYESIRFNTGTAPYFDVKGGFFATTGGLLVTPNLGPVNVGVCSLNLANTTCQIVQNNTTALLVIGIENTSTSVWQAFTGAGSTGTAGDADTADSVVKSGAGTMFLNPIAGTLIPINFTNSSGAYAQSSSGRITAGTYDSIVVSNTTSAAFYLNGGVTVINSTLQLGNPTTQGTTAGGMGTVNLNGGTLMDAMASISLTNGVAAGSPARPVFLGGNGGGLAAQNGITFTIPGVISGADGSGPLTIGIPASSANGNTAGLAPGTGTSSGIANGTNVNPAFYATGTVALTGANTHTGGTVLDTGVLSFTAGALGTGGLTFNGGALQWAGVNNTDISSQPVTLGSGGGTLDVNGNTVTLANAIGGGGGALTVRSTAAGGALNLSGTNTYAGNTVISAGATLTLSGAGQLGGGDYAGSITINGTLNFDSSAPLQTLSGVLSGGGALNQTGSGTLALTGLSASYTGNATVGAGALIVNNILGAGAVTVGGAGVLGGGGTIMGNVTVQSGGQTLPGGATTTIGGNLTYDSGAFADFHLTSSATGSGNDQIVLSGASGALNCGSATVGVNCGATLDQAHNYVLFNLTGASSSVTGRFNPAPQWLGAAPAGATNYWIVTTATQVLLEYAPVAPPDMTFSYSISGGNLTLGWPGGYLGWRLESNAVDVSNTNYWIPYDGSQSNTSENILLDPAQTNVFFRLIYP